VAARYARSVIVASRKGYVVESTWASRDLPVLDAAVRLLEDDSAVRADQIVKETGFDLETVLQALDALRGEFIVDLIKPVTPGAWRFTRVTADARRVVGQWPTAENLTSRLAAAFGEAADDERDPERKSRLHQIASFLADTGKDVAAEVLAKVILRPSGMG
jgi:hypothetical protein